MVDGAEQLDRSFSLFIRVRDAMDGGMTRCISCGRVMRFEKMQCGHFFGRGNMSVRWDEDNCHAECWECNCHDPDHLIGYERNLRRKIGDDAFNALKTRAGTPRRWEAWELDGLSVHYMREARKIARKKGIHIG